MELSQVRRGWRWPVFCLLTCMAVLEFSVRGPIRGLGPSRDFNDFLSPYVQTRAWFSGRDPYAASTLSDMWPVVPPPPFLLPESADGTLAAQRGLPSPYMTTAFPLLLPIAELPWRIAIRAWFLLCVVAVLVAVWALIHLAGVRGRSPLALAILVSELVLAPVHTAIAAANIVTVVLALSLVATFCLMRNRPGMAGVLLTLAVALKSTVALPFVIYALLSRMRIRVVVPAVATGILLLSVAIIPPHGRTLWWKSFLANNQAMFAPNAIDDFSTGNPLHFQLINLQVALFPILHNRTLAQLGAALAFVVLIILWLWAVRRDRQIGLLDLAIVASAALLPVYHRFTDAGLLVVPVAWALIELEGERRRFAVGCLVLASPFLVPGATMLHEFSRGTGMLQDISRSRLWNCFILPHECWSILMLCAVLLAARCLPKGHNPVQLERGSLPSRGTAE